MEIGETSNPVSHPPLVNTVQVSDGNIGTESVPPSELVDRGPVIDGNIEDTELVPPSELVNPVQVIDVISIETESVPPSELVNPVQVIDGNIETEIVPPSLVNPAQVINEELAPPSKLLKMFDGLDLKEKDFYEARDPLRIFIIPTYIKQRNQAAYEPKMVSIGPYHYGKAALEPMQLHKKRALTHFLNRSPTKTKDQYIDKLKEVVGDLRNCYEGQVEEMKRWEDDEHFVKLMMVDGVFIFEFLNVLKGNKRCRDYAEIDPIFGYRGHNLNYNYVMQDLLLLENQIPYQVLHILLTVSEGSCDEAAKGILSALMFAPQSQEGHHLLDMYIKGMLGARTEEQPSTGENAVKISASKLSKLGMKFRPVRTYEKMKFDRTTKTLSLPSIVVNQHTIPRFFNSQVYQLRAGTNTDLNSYLHLVDFLIQSADDVSSLRSQGIIVSSLGSDRAVVKVIQTLTKDTVPVASEDKSSEMIREVIEYYKDKEGKVATLWLWVAENWVWFLFAGVVMYALTAAQVVFSALSYYHRRDK
ncbi:hypothetical protein MKW92_048975 [Papaver armeniacum]|nr:hypothetical protein MKW92_048975 [Papaver armeniacum]